MPVPKHHSPVQSVRTPLTEVAYHHLLDQIGSGALEAGVRLDDRKIASELDMSPATVRHAIGRLAEIGLVDTASNRYTRVAAASPERFIATVTVATALWRLGGKLFLEHHEDRLAAQFHRRIEHVTSGIDDITDGNAFISSVLDVFEFLTDNSANPVLIETAARLRPVIAHTARLGEPAYDLMGTVALMEALDEAVADGDPAALDRALTVIDQLADEFIERHETT